MSLESKITSYSTTLRKVAFCHILMKLYPLNKAEKVVLDSKYERFLNTMASLNLIDDEIEKYLSMEKATKIVDAFINKKTEFIDIMNIQKCNMAMAMAMEQPLYMAWAAMDVLVLTANYPGKVDLNNPNVYNTIDSTKLEMAVGLNIHNKRGAALFMIIRNAIKDLH
jgi:uncharacterized membrane protein YjfL (UPF0719 family)